MRQTRSHHFSTLVQTGLRKKHLFAVGALIGILIGFLIGWFGLFNVLFLMKVIPHAGI
jgi:hypothetical protein